MPNKNSQLNTILLVVLIVLVGGLLFTMWNKNDGEKMDDNVIPNQVEQIPNTQTKTNNNPSDADYQPNPNYTKTFLVPKEIIRLGSSDGYNKNFPGFTLNYKFEYKIEADISESCGTECSASPYYRGINIIDPVKDEGFGYMNIVTKDDYKNMKAYHNISFVKTSTIGGKNVDEYKVKVPAYVGDVSVAYYVDVGQDLYIQLSSSRALSIENIIDVRSIKLIN